MRKAVFFDFNGVLVDDEHLHCALMRDVLRGEGFELTDEMYARDFLALDDERCMAEAFRRMGKSLDAARSRALVAEKEQRYMVEAEQGTVQFFPGAVRLVRTAAERFPVAIVSGANRREIEYLLARERLTECVTSVVATGETPRGKPFPDPYLKALALVRAKTGADLAAGEAVTVEDSTGGCQSAHAAGVAVIGVGHSVNVDELRKSTDRVALKIADITVEMLAETTVAKNSEKQPTKAHRA